MPAFPLFSFSDIWELGDILKVALHHLSFANMFKISFEEKLGSVVKSQIFGSTVMNYFHLS